jgi:hypothetical protein
MSNLFFSLNATLPVFLVMVVGYVLKHIGILNDEFVRVSNQFNFKVTLPVLLFTDIAATNIRENFDARYVLFCAAITTIAFFGIWIGAKLLIRDKSIIGAFVQASYRSSAAIMGVAFIQNIYGTSGMAPLMIIGSVPLFNIYAVLVLTFESNDSSDRQSGAVALKKALKNIAKNPIIIGILCGIVASCFNLYIPPILDKTLSSIAALASPLALIAIGAGFKGRAAIAKIKPTLAAACIKLILLPGIFLFAAVKMGFYDQKLVALIVMLGSPTTPSSYIMAENMHGDGVLTSSTVVVTTLLSSVTLTFWIFVARSLGYIL